MYSSSLAENRAHSATIGVHGYDNLSKDMRAIFVAHGPAFAKQNHCERRAMVWGPRMFFSIKRWVFGVQNDSTTTTNQHKGVKRGREQTHRAKINNVDVYGILANILRVKPGPNNGTRSNMMF